MLPQALKKRQATVNLHVRLGPFGWFMHFLKPTSSWAEHIKASMCIKVGFSAVYQHIKERSEEMSSSRVFALPLTCVFLLIVQSGEYGAIVIICFVILIYMNTQSAKESYWHLSIWCCSWIRVKYFIYFVSEMKKQRVFFFRSWLWDYWRDRSDAPLAALHCFTERQQPLVWRDTDWSKMGSHCCPLWKVRARYIYSLTCPLSKHICQIIFIFRLTASRIWCPDPLKDTVLCSGPSTLTFTGLDYNTKPLFPAFVVSKRWSWGCTPLKKRNLPAKKSKFSKVFLIPVMINKKRLMTWCCSR